MFTKIYDKIRTFIKENYKELLIILFIFALFNIPLSYSIYTPGGMINLDKRIESKDKLYESTGSINSTYVSMIKGTIPMMLISKIMPSWDIISNDKITLDDENIEDTIKRDRVYLQESISNATLSAFNAANIDIKINKSENIITYISDKSKTNLKIYDNILEYDSIKFNNFNDFQNYISSKKEGDNVYFKVLRNNKIINAYANVIEMDKISKVGIMISQINEYDSIPKINVKTKSSESGPSGGLMTALAIYDAVTEKDITKGLIIAGTGTIDAEGTVGEISGIKYKIAGAAKHKADIFLCPKENYEEAKKFTENKGYDIMIVSINKLRDAIDFLEGSV